MKESPSLIQQIQSTLTGLAFVYQTLVAVAYIFVLIAAYQFYTTPFMGAFFEHTMLINDIIPPQRDWQLYQKGAEFGDQLIAINGERVQNAALMREILHRYYPGESVTVTLRAQNGAIKELVVELKQFSSNDLLAYFIIPLFVSIVFIGVSLWIYSLRRTETSGRAFTVLGAAVAAVTAGLFDLYTTHYLTALWTFSVPMVGAAMIHLALVFPQEARIVNRYPLLRWVGYLIAVVMSVASFTTLYNFNQPYAYLKAWQNTYLFTALGLLFFIFVMLYRLLPSESPVVRQQARTVLFGALIAFGPIIWFLLRAAFTVVLFDTRYFLPVITFPIVTGYTVLRFRLIRTDYILGRSVLYAILTMLALSGYVLLSIGLSMVFGITVRPDNPLLIGLMVFLVVLLLNPVRARLQEVIDSIFFRGERAHQERLKAFTRALTSAVDAPDILRILREQVSLSLLPGTLHIYTYDVVGDQYIAARDETGNATSDIRFVPTSPLAQELRKERLPLFVDELHMPTNLQSERGRMALLGAQVFAPLPGRDRLIGWLAIGERLSGESYANHDIAFLESLGSQSAVALERSQVVSNLERRVSEMNALARIAQGINITLNFDDILELIYAQTTQIIPGSDFHLTLYNKTGQNFYYSFYLENDERIPERENIPLLPKSTLDQEIIYSRRAILTQDFAGQCQVMGVTPHVRGLYASLGVPLNTGTETLGALSIASRNPTTAYTAAQMELLQSIADQASGAIVKSRLLQETERRAQQLSTLNIITRQLTSTLELQPLLKNILESAVNILNSEAGTLFLVDQQTDELVFQVTVGPAAPNLVGQRLPPGTGVVGKAVTTRQPVIVNDVQATATWNADTDKQTGFITRAILVVPMEVKERVIGVIEIINKKDGLPFGVEDQNLLSAFAGQAAVAIENARLYTMTDQELTARVEELSVMQRIDRELNASLEVERTMRITLEWAMRQSQAEAGFIGFVQAKGVHIMAHQGFSKEMEPYQDDFLSLEHPAISEVITSGQPRRIVMDDAKAMGAFLNGSNSQLVIPIRREATVIGLFLLESPAPDRFQQDTLAFLSRLSDHAAIAIANGQLYAEVQAANIAKSEFVSFVAHELKNPMTSIKGYAELLASGAVGPISEMQSNFLNTIRSNTERMKTIVEDLNDNSKIEAGRMRLDYRAVDVAELVEDAVRSISKQIDEKKQTAVVNIPASLPKIWADRTRISQVLVNLVSNAYKYTPESGELLINAERSDNIWDPQGSPQVVHIWVKDNGIGISPEDQKKIFQKFFRSEDDQARKSPGTGLGLNITRSLVEMQGGRIWFESEFRQGTTFHFTVPISES
ncbi:MAG: hypothetical protein CO094_12465 [Anaerolineae bacterium CG_4_9_14_3_um_filter_57_17]|nr:GAF domain-containing protein [bacterium]NCT20624.1 GAF domain-containing protein [bacterium]OIO85669.1 MAG: hypothetical protein AUK01_05470 [Anaerolineae bacterium CG2_30_57_67]PJB64584.1 MAG: hypothetical protein CO094_12465 [Anaerolineae bacterium CG_4_9_14_3_um_filter_57_17]